MPELRLGFSAYLQHLFQGMELTDRAGNLSPLLLLANNLRASAPPRPPSRPRRGGGWGAVGRRPPPARPLYAASLLPHGIFELPALILAFSMGLYICGHLTGRCRRDPAALPLGACLGLAARLLVFLLLPLLILAALTEAYVTPLAAGLFL